MARLYLLTVNGQPVAGCYGLTSHGCFLALQTGLDPAWMRHSAGVAVMGMAVEDCIGRGCHTFDFLRGNERYKFHWTRVMKQTITIRFFNDSISGLIQMFTCQLAIHWRRLRSAARQRIEGSAIARKFARNPGIPSR